MTTFHKPKVYRSPTGCCICKAKSSSSRFTDSKKYEDTFEGCFLLTEPRKGEICNACVLLVKRYKKREPDPSINWKHVVDSRAGPGMKSASRLRRKKKKKSCSEKPRTEGEPKKLCDREMSPVLDDKSVEDVEMSEMNFSCEGSPDSSRTASPRDSDLEEMNVAIRSRKRKGPPRRLDTSLPGLSEFIDLSYWNREIICCGIIFRGQCGEITADPRFLKPCTARLSKCQLSQKQESKAEVENCTSKSFSDSSSDSGYDESSNQGAIAESAFKKEQVSIETLKTN